MIFLALFAFVMTSIVLQSSIASMFEIETEWPVREVMRLGTRLRFVPRRIVLGNDLDRFRFQLRVGVRLPRIGLVSVL